MKEKLKVGILGATGAVGQKFVELLEGHPWFEIGALMASERSAGAAYRETVDWISSRPLPAAAGRMRVQSAVPDTDCVIIFSGLDASVATSLEATFASAGYAVVSNAKSYRMDPTVPLVIPEVNADHLALIDEQKWEAGGSIVTNPNCSTVGLVSALKPLQEAFGLEGVSVTTMQAISGAGYPGVPALDIVGNVIPFIEGEEDKIVREPRKLLGTVIDGRLTELDLPISAQCNRVPVVDGHLLSVSVRLSADVDLKAVQAAFQDYRSPIESLDLPNSGQRFLRFFDDDRYPQPARQAGLGGGMTVSVGRLRRCPILDYRFVALVHNTVRGAAGGAILNAELMVARGYIGQPGGRS